MRSLIYFLILILFISCSLIKHEGVAPDYNSPVEFELNKKDSIYSLTITNKVDSLTYEQAKANIYNLIANTNDAKLARYLTVEYIKTFKSNFNDDRNRIVKNNLAGNYELLGETFKDSLIISDTSKLVYNPPNSLLLVYKNDVLNLTLVDKNKIGGFYKDEKIYLNKID